MPTHIDTNFDIYKPPNFICFHIPHVTFHDTINVQALLPFHITKPSFYMCVCINLVYADCGISFMVLFYNYHMLTCIFQKYLNIKHKEYSFLMFCSVKC